MALAHTKRRVELKNWASKCISYRPVGLKKKALRFLATIPAQTDATPHQAKGYFSMGASSLDLDFAIRT